MPPINVDKFSVGVYSFSANQPICSGSIAEYTSKGTVKIDHYFVEVMNLFWRFLMAPPCMVYVWYRKATRLFI